MHLLQLFSCKYYDSLVEFLQEKMYIFYNSLVVIITTHKSNFYRKTVHFLQFFSCKHYDSLVEFLQENCTFFTTL